MVLRLKNVGPRIDHKRIDETHGIFVKFTNKSLIYDFKLNFNDFNTSIRSILMYNI